MKGTWSLVLRTMVTGVSAGQGTGLAGSWLLLGAGGQFHIMWTVCQPTSLQRLAKATAGPAPDMTTTVHMRCATGSQLGRGAG
jgi:hypothetical protein